MEKGPKKTNIECVIYDCDGVLFDSFEANNRLYNHIAVSLGRPLLTEQEILFCHTHTVYESLHRIFDANEEEEKRALAFLKGTNLSDYIVYLKMEPNLLETLGRLKEMGIKRAINTSRTTTMKFIMERFGLEPYFDMVVTALDVEKPKPDPESMIKILTALGLERDKVIYIGDSEVDKETALASGIRFFSYKNRDIATDGLIDDHLALLELL